MTNQIQTASEAKNSNLTSTLAHETRKNKQWLSMLVIAAFVVLTALTSCGSGGGSRSGSSSDGSDKILNGTYSAMTGDSRGEVSLTFSGNKLKMVARGTVQELTYELVEDYKEKDFSRGKLIVITPPSRDSNGSRDEMRYVLEGKQLSLDGELVLTKK